MMDFFEVGFIFSIKSIVSALDSNSVTQDFSLSTSLPNLTTNTRD